MNTLLDASALLAMLFDEEGAGEVISALRRGAVMSAVNVAEVAARLHQDRWPAEEVAGTFNDVGVEIAPFGSDAALLSGCYRPATAKLGLSLGDRACLATAATLCLPVLTADRVWRELELPGVEVECIR